MANRIPPLFTRTLGISFTRSVRINPNVRVTSTSFSVSNVAIVAIISAFTGVGLEHLGSFLAVKKDDPPNPPTTGQDLATPTQYVLVFSNFSCNEIDATPAIEKLSFDSQYKWEDADGQPVKPQFAFFQDLTQAQLLTLLNFRQKLPSPSCDYYTQKTLFMLDVKYGTPEGVS